MSHMMESERIKISTPVCDLSLASRAKVQLHKTLYTLLAHDPWSSHLNI